MPKSTARWSVRLRKPCGSSGRWGQRWRTSLSANGKRLTELFPAISGPEFAEFHRPFYEKNPDGYGASVRERLEWSLKISSDEYVRGLRERELLRREVANSFAAQTRCCCPPCHARPPPIESLMANVNGKEYPCMWIHRPFQSPAQSDRMSRGGAADGFRSEGIAAVAPDRRSGMERRAYPRHRQCV